MSLILKFALIDEQKFKNQLDILKTHINSYYQSKSNKGDE